MLFKNECYIYVAQIYKHILCSYHAEKVIGCKIENRACTFSCSHSLHRTVC